MIKNIHQKELQLEPTQVLLPRKMQCSSRGLAPVETEIAFVID